MSKAAAARHSAISEQQAPVRVPRRAAPSPEELREAYAMFGLAPPDEEIEPEAPAPAQPAAPALAEEERSAAFAAFGEAEEEVPAAALPVPVATQPEPQAEAEPEPARCTLPAVIAVNDNNTLPARPLRFPRLSPRGPRAPASLAVRFLQAMDWIVVALAAELAARWGLGAGLGALTIAQAGSVLIGALALKGGLWLTDAYKLKPGSAGAEQGAGGLALGAIVGLGGAALLAPHAHAAAALAAVLPAAAILLAGLHAGAAVWLNLAHRAGVFSDRIAVIGATEAAERMIERARETGEARIVAVVDDRAERAPSHIAGLPVAGTVADLLSWPSLPEVDRIVIAVPPRAEARVRAIIERLRIAPNRVDLLFDVDAQTARGKGLGRLGHAPAACVTGPSHCALRAFVKRAEDLVIGSGLVLAFAPIMALVALAVRLDSKGPVLFRQQRHGFNNRVITVLKFRTMRAEPAQGPLRQVQANDPRVTRLGKFLRATSLDELPQLFNVLSGEMSLVGPRPHAVGMRAAEQALEDIAAEYAFRHRVKPGLTGWAQVNGSRGPIETPDAVRERVRLDLEYVAKHSLWLDLWILFRTVPSLLGDRKNTR